MHVASAVNLPIRIHSRLSKSQMGEFENLDKLSGVLDVTLHNPLPLFLPLLTHPSSVRLKKYLHHTFKGFVIFVELIVRIATPEH